MKIFRKLYQDEGGQAIALIALILVALLGFAALVVDVGMMANSRSNLQKTADAAALAAAMDLPNDATDAAGLVKVNNTANYYVNLNAGSGITTVVVSDVPNKRVKVTVSESVEHFFAGVLGIDSNIISATAVAEKREKWAGEALPFINLDDNYTIDTKIEAWENTGLGHFESLWPGDAKIPSEYVAFDFGKKKDDDQSMGYFMVNYGDGIRVTNGGVDPIKQEIGYIYDQQKTVYYLFSLSSEVITNKKYTEYQNKQNIPLSDLVLLQVSFDKWETTGPDSTKAFLTVLDVFDVSNGVFPTDNLLNPKVTSRLVE